jgi:hypothetical protein
MGQLVQNPSSRLKGGGNYIAIIQVDKQADGTFAAHTGTDAFGAAAGTVHLVGSVEETAISRDDNGSHSFDVTVVEMDLDRKNFLINAAPFSTTSANAKEELNLEDGTVLESTDSGTDDPNRPYFQIMVFGAPTAAGKEHVFFGIAQFSRSGGFNQKAKSFAKPKVKAQTVDGNGFACTLPSTVTFPRFTGVTAPTLADAKRHGIWVEEV